MKDAICDFFKNNFYKKNLLSTSVNCIERRGRMLLLCFILNIQVAN